MAEQARPADAAKQWCRKWPQRAVLVACMGLSALGTITVLANGGEAESKAVEVVAGFLVPLQLVCMLAAELSQWRRRRLLTLSLGLVLWTLPSLFLAAEQASAAGAGGLSFGATCALMASMFAWLAFLPPPSTLYTALADYRAAVGLMAVSGGGVFLLWLAGTGAMGAESREGVWLSPLAAVSGLLFLTAAVADPTEHSAWLAAFVGALVASAGMYGLCDIPGAGGKLAAAVVALGSALQLRWVCIQRLFGENEPWLLKLEHLTINFSARMGLLAALLALLGVVLASVGVPTAEGGYRWATVCLLAAPLLLVATRLSTGGRRAALVIMAAALALPAAQAVVAVGGAYGGAHAAAAGRAFLVLAGWLAFASPKWLDAGSALAGVRDGMGEDSGRLRASGVGCLALGALLQLCSARSFGADAGPWLLSLHTLAFFLAAVQLEAPPLLVWLNLLWNGAALALTMQFAFSALPAAPLVGSWFALFGVVFLVLFELRTVDDPELPFEAVPASAEAGFGEGEDDELDVDLSAPVLPDDIPEMGTGV